MLKLYNETSLRGTGFVDLGDDETAVTKAQVLVVAGLSGHWKAPVANYLTTTLTRDVQAQLIKHVLEALAEININVCSVTMDGHAINVAMYRQLGCAFDSTSQSHQFFKHPLTGCEAYVTFDPCHM